MPDLWWQVIGMLAAFGSGYLFCLYRNTDLGIEDGDILDPDEPAERAGVR